MRDEGRFDDRILGEITGGEGKTRQRQRTDHHRDVGERNAILQAAHVADVLLVMHRVDYRAGS